MKKDQLPEHARDSCPDWIRDEHVDVWFHGYLTGNESCTKDKNNKFWGRLRQLHLSAEEKIFGGLCGGLSKCFVPPAWVWRVLFIFLGLAWGVGLAIYVIFWLCIPREVDSPRGCKSDQE
jgi:phage shock protein PspC (stress-responsive transcriptional regulator)